MHSRRRYPVDPLNVAGRPLTSATGVGINLTTADTVIIFDSDWNPQNDLQAQARCHRSVTCHEHGLALTSCSSRSIGQKVPVKVYRLLTRDTYEKHMFDTASKKLGLSTVVLGMFETRDRSALGLLMPVP